MTDPASFHLDETPSPEPIPDCRRRPSAVAGGICALFLGATLRATAAPSSPEEVWADYDPRREPIEMEVLKRWNEGGANYVEFYFTGMHGPLDRLGAGSLGRLGAGPPEKVRAYALYAAPEGGRRLPAVLHIHGGGQTLAQNWLRFWTARGYAALSYDFCGHWEKRTKFTQWGSLAHGNMAETGTRLMATEPSVHASSWYLWECLARRALTVLEQQPEVDRARLGLFGISVGGSIVWPVAAMDARVKAAAAIYGCGWTTWPASEAEPDPGATDAKLQHWRATMEPEAYAPLVRCPLLFLNASNDQHGKMDFAFRSLARLTGEWRQAHTPRFRHHIGPGQELNLPLWMDWWLKGTEAWPKTPAAELRLGSNGVPALTVAPDLSRTVQQVEVFYALENPRPINRFWRSASAAIAGGEWTASLPVLDVQQPLYAFANVTYVSGICLGSRLLTATPAKFGPARATDAPSLLIDDFRHGVGDWLTHSPGTDPIPPMPALVRAVTGPGGRPGVTLSRPVPLLTHKIGDPKWRGPRGAALQFEVFTPTARELTVAIHEHEFTTQARKFIATTQLRASSEWQVVSLPPERFRGPDATARPEWASARMLEISTQGEPGPEPVHTGFRWVLPPEPAR